jgi:hypothetical protein
LIFAGAAFMSGADALGVTTPLSTPEPE